MLPIELSLRRCRGMQGVEAMRRGRVSRRRCQEEGYMHTPRSRPEVEQAAAGVDRQGDSTRLAAAGCTALEGTNFLGETVKVLAPDLA